MVNRDVRLEMLLAQTVKFQILIGLNGFDRNTLICKNLNSYKIIIDNCLLIVSLILKKKIRSEKLFFFLH